jgi:hypothetical protein
MRLAIFVTALFSVAASMTATSTIMPAAAADSLSPGGTIVDDDGGTHEPDIEAIAAEQITLGCNPPARDRFCPDDPVTRGQMAAFLTRAVGNLDG